MNGTPAGGMGKPQAIAHAAVYLASEEAAFVHGVVLDVDGGRTTTAVVASPAVHRAWSGRARDSPADPGRGPHL
ncbi:hypothetical protein Mco01_64830 [Microbispora corallina]|uniref:SDR family oxidoreductase n=2 Tax=Microbispora corallina TaxID=83302 RepID=A0ABQ4G8U6_9ACTN|nr:hypothetical protein Mco01_64830 [Microbispora corallina]